MWKVWPEPVAGESKAIAYSLGEVAAQSWLSLLKSWTSSIRSVQKTVTAKSVTCGQSANVAAEAAAEGEGCSCLRWRSPPSISCPAGYQSPLRCKVLAQDCPLTAGRYEYYMKIRCNRLYPPVLFDNFRSAVDLLDCGHNLPSVVRPSRVRLK
jgi:hypothetical protein